MAVWYVSSAKYATVTARANSTAYVIGDIRRQGPGTPTVGQERVFRCTTAGTSGATEPTATNYTGSTTTRGGTVTDGTVTWTEITGNSTYGWTAPHGTLTGGLNQTNTAGDTYYVDSGHAESSTTQPKSIATLGSNTAPLHIYCVNSSAAPPTALATGATVTYTGGTMTGVTTAGYLDVYGITFTATGFEFYNTAYGRQIYNACNFTFTGAGSGTLALGTTNAVQGNEVQWQNCTLKFSATGQSVVAVNNNAPAGPFVWKGGSIDSAGSAPTTLFTGATASGSCTTTLMGVDLSALGSGKNLVSLAQAGCTFRLIDCKLGSSVSITTGSAISGQADVQVVNSDSSATNYRYYKSIDQGTEQQETTIVRSGGASDGTTTVSRKVVTNTLSDDFLYSPYLSLPIEVWNTTTSGNVTLTIATVTDNVTLTNADAWLEAEFQGATTSPLGSWSTSRVSDPVFGSATNLTTDSTSTWTTTGLTTPVKQKLSITIAPKAVGLIRLYVAVAKASTTVYYDPLAQVS
jgi:hypothetical protein